MFPKIGNKARVSIFTTVFQHNDADFSQSSQARKGNKRRTYWRAINKMSLFVDDMIVYVENHKKSTPPQKNLLEQMSSAGSQDVKIGV